jgi:hypothetical protein
VPVSIRDGVRLRSAVTVTGAFEAPALDMRLVTDAAGAQASPKSNGGNREKGNSRS